VKLSVLTFDDDGVDPGHRCVAILAPPPRFAAFAARTISACWIWIKFNLNLASDIGWEFVQQGVQKLRILLVMPVYYTIEGLHDFLC